MSVSRRILVVEDEKVIRETVTAYLEKDGHWVTPVADGEKAIAAVRKRSFDLVVLDLMLPKVSGEDVCRAIRDVSDVPIIMLTAKGDEEDRVTGLAMGADDYLVKPFSPRELVARVRALLRRARVSEAPQRDSMVFGSLSIDVAGHKAAIDGVDVDLTATEFKLLITLARYPGKVYTRLELVEKVLGWDFDRYERAVDSHVKNLRSKLNDDPKNPSYIYTVHGVGYRFDPPQTEE